jgi:hypothetical protein
MGITWDDNHWHFNVILWLSLRRALYAARMTVYINGLKVLAGFKRVGWYECHRLCRKPSFLDRLCRHRRRDIRLL